MSLYQDVVFEADPVDLMRVDGSYDVFHHAGPLVVLELWSEVDITCGLGDLNDELGRPMDKPAFVPGAAAVFGQDS
jgi:hypothetical protein